jgi:hypothetical protein
MKPTEPLVPRNLTVACLLGWSLAILGVFFLSHASMVEPLGGFAGTLGTALATAVAFHICGWRIFRTLRRFFPGQLDGLDLFAIEMGLGLGVAMLGLFAMGLLGLYGPTSVIGFVVVLAMTVGNPRNFLRDLLSRWREMRQDLSTCTPAERFFGLIVVLVAIMTGLQSLTPETSQDALVYHLAAPDLYVQSGSFHFIPGNFYASFPQNVEMLYTLALLLGDSSLAAWYHWWLGIGAALAVACLARRASGGKGGLVAATIFLTIPSAALVSTWAYVEMGWILFQMLTILCFLIWRREGSTGWIVLAGVFAGLAAGCKYTGGSIGLIVLGLIAVFGPPTQAGLRPRLVAGTLFSFTVAAVVSPWLIKNIVFTGNPLYPFMHGVFGGRDWDAERAAAFGMFLKNWGDVGSLTDWLMLPVHLTFGSRFSSIESFDGMIGPAFLLGAPLVILGWRRDANLTVLGVIAAALGMLWLITTHQIRFLLPTLACLAAMIGGGLPRVLGGHALSLGRVVLGGAFVLNVTLIGWHFVSHDPLQVVTGLEREDRYLAREIPCGDYPVFAYIDQQLEGDARVFMAASGNPGFLCRRPYFMDALFENHTLKKLLARAENAADLHALFREDGFTHILFRWDLIFDSQGLRSGLERDEQTLFAAFLNMHAQLEYAHSGTSLYRITAAAPALPKNSGGTP